jgi:soluble cytochrome b562
MKTLVILVAMMSLFSMTALAADDCQKTYDEAMKRVKEAPGVTYDRQVNLIKKLETALQFCKEGKTDTAKRILEEVRNEEDMAEAFSNMDRN